MSTRFVLVVALLFAACAGVDASPVIFVVRHAEKAATGGNDPDLSAAGQKRADALAHMLKDAELSAIFTTEFKRTQQTAAPTAKATQISPTVVPSNDMQALLQKLRGLKGNALVVGHGNTIPGLFKALGVETAVNIADNDYTELFIIMLNDKPQLVRMHYSF